MYENDIAGADADPVDKDGKQLEISAEGGPKTLPYSKCRPRFQHAIGFLTGHREISPSNSRGVLSAYPRTRLGKGSYSWRGSDILQVPRGSGPPPERNSNHQWTFNATKGHLPLQGTV